METNSPLISALLLLCGAALALAETCPKMEDMMMHHCMCHPSMESRRELILHCMGDTPPDMEKPDFKAIFAKLQGKKIAELMMFGCPFKRIPSDLFKGMRIRRLNFQTCDLEGLATTDDDLPFQGLEDSLEKLQIDNCFEGANELNHMKLSHLKRLKEVFSVDNNVPEIKNDWFPSSVEEITFQRCQVKKIGDQAFASLPHLEYLTLSDNAIGDLSRSMLPKPASKLESLLLDDNRVSSLPDLFFTGMPALNHVDLENNDLRRLPEPTWSPVWSQLEQLYLEDNLLLCDSHMDWMFALDRPVSLSGTCASPRDKKGTPLDLHIENNRKKD